MPDELDFLADTTEQTSTRFVTFVTPELHRFDLAITISNHFYGKLLVIDLQKFLSAIIGPDDLEEEGFLERAYRLDEKQASELYQFLSGVVGPITYPE